MTPFIIILIVYTISILIGIQWSKSRLKLHVAKERYYHHTLAILFIALFFTSCTYKDSYVEYLETTLTETQAAMVVLGQENLELRKALQRDHMETAMYFSQLGYTYGIYNCIERIQPIIKEDQKPFLRRTINDKNISIWWKELEREINESITIPQSEGSISLPRSNTGNHRRTLESNWDNTSSHW